MYCTIYKTTNSINGKFYIGKHQTKNLDDGYLGSGKLLKRAIAKHGIENFSKQILFVFESEAEMDAKEKELVVICEQSYNLCEGGKGGFGYINKNGLCKHSENGKKGSLVRNHMFQTDPVFRASVMKNLQSPTINKCPPPSWKGKRHKETTKQKMSLAKKDKNKGKDNSQYGSKWITNGIINKKTRHGTIPVGFWLGRTLIAF